jgi:hypothetical protein
MENWDLYSHRGQEVILLLTALHTVRKARSKEEILNLIESKGWIDFHTIDKRPYRSSETGEHRWRTSIAFARTTCIELGFMEAESCHWLATTKGLNTIPKIKELCIKNEFDVRKCWLFSAAGKKFFDPHYEASDSDTPRPARFYKDEKMTVTEMLEKLSHL